MKNLIGLFAAMLALVVLATNAAAQDQRPRYFPVSQDARDARNAGDFEAALRAILNDINTCTASEPVEDECQRVVLYASNILYDMQQYETGESVARSAVTLSESFSEPDDPDRADSYMSLGKHLARMSVHEEAEALFKTSLDLRAASFGESNSLTADSANALGSLYLDLGRYAEAEIYLRRALEGHRAATGERAPATAFTMMGLQFALSRAGKFVEAEAIGRETVAILEANRIEAEVGLLSLNPVNAALTEAAGRFNLAQTLSSLGRFEEADVETNRAIALRLAASNNSGHYVAEGLVANSRSLMRKGRLDEAEAAAREAFQVAGEFHGPRVLMMAPFQEHLESVLQAQGNLEEAGELAENRLAALRRFYGDAHPAIAEAQLRLASLLSANGDQMAAETALDEALVTAHAVYGEGSVRTAPYLLALAQSAFGAERYDDAARKFETVKALVEPVLSDLHPISIQARGLMGTSLFLEGSDKAGAIDLMRDASASAIMRTRRAGIDPDELSEFRKYRDLYVSLLHAEWALGSEATGPEQDWNEAFQAAQWAMSNDAAATMAKVAANYARAGEPVSELMARRVDLEQQRTAAEELYFEFFSDPARRDARDQAAAARDRLDLEIREIDAQISASDPAFANLTRASALSLDETQALLREDEAVLLTFTTFNATFAFLVTAENVEATRSEVLDEQTVRNAVTDLRDFIDIALTEGVASFDQDSAHLLYSELIAPFAQTLSQKRVLVTVANDPLASLPFSLLVEQPAEDPEDFAAMQFLIERVAVLSLPSVSSIKALRCLLVDQDDVADRCGDDRSTRTGEVAPTIDFAGLGAPKLSEADSSAGRSLQLPEFSAAFEGQLANTEYLRSLDSLPGAQEEIASVSSFFEEDRTLVRVGEAATETMVKQSEGLEKSRFVLFSTHGLLASESSVSGEPGLVMTPPAAEQRSELDDGFLTASEAARLKLIAELVILSACNTATVEGEANSQGLSALARSFLFAGADSLMVSHWVISDDATAQLITEFFQNELSDGADRAEAMRSAILATKATPERGNPAYWAAFSLIGLPQ